jgi:integrase
MKTPDLPPSTPQPNIWQLASEHLPPSLAEKVGTVQHWSDVRRDVKILRALQPGDEDARLAKLEGLTLSQRISALKPSMSVEKQLKQLKTAIVDDYGRGEAGRDALIIIARVLETENRFRIIPLPVPEVPRTQPRQTNPVEHTNAVDAIRTMRWLQAAVHKWIDAVKPPKSDKNDPAFRPDDSEYDENSSESRVPAGLIALSAIVEGDLLHHTSVHALRLRLLEPKCPIEWWFEVPSEGQARLPFQISRPFIDLSLGWGSTDDAELRRWFPDPQTACLIARSYRKQTLDIDENATRLSQLWFEIRDGLLTHGGKIDSPPRSLAALLSVVRLSRFVDNYPALLVNYCGRRIVSHSVRRLILPRFAGERLRFAPHDISESTPIPAFPLSQSLDTAPQISSSRWYRDLLDAFKEEDGDQVQRNLERLVASLTNYPDSARCIMGFAAFAVANDSAAGNHLAPSTVRSYTSVVARYLGGYLRGEHPISFSPSELISIYGEVLDLADQARNARAARRRLGRALWEFHHYLVTKHGIPNVNKGEVFGIGRDLVPVDANLLTPDEYFKVRDKVLELAPKSELGDLGDLARILLSLGFWLGLRRTEAHGLRTIDVCELGLPMLVIRPWDGRHLKSKSSTRVLPLALLPEDELLDVLKWTYKRREELDGVGNEQFLFGLPKLAQDQVTVEVFALVQRAMREVTGDHTLHYHHLRHSAASWAFLRLCVSDFREVIDLFPEPKTTDLLRDSERFRSIIYSAFPINKGEARYELSEEDRYATDGPIRQHSFAIALLLGHADPSTTLEH